MEIVASDTGPDGCYASDLDSFSIALYSLIFLSIIIKSYMNRERYNFERQNLIQTRVPYS